MRGRAVLTRRRVLQAIGLALVLLLSILAFGSIALLPRPLLQFMAQRNPRVLFFVDTPQPAIALTIDDGPHRELTPQILEVLRQNGAKATFFVIGERVPGNEDLLQQMRVEGHEIGNHLWRDTPSIFLPKSEFVRQLRDVDRLIAPATQPVIAPPPKWFRPGSGWFHRRMLNAAEAQGYRCCLASVYPQDNKLRRPGLIEDLILERIFPGAVLVLHSGEDERAYTVEVLRQVLPQLTERGYRVLTVSQLVALGEGTPPTVDTNQTLPR